MLRKLIYFWKESWLLMVSSVVFGLILAATESAWGPRIEENQVRLFNKQAGQLLPEATTFEAVAETISISTEQGTPQQADVRKALNGSTPFWSAVKRRDSAIKSKSKTVSISRNTTARRSASSPLLKPAIPSRLTMKSSPSPEPP
jgi:hypothetical protein